MYSTVHTKHCNGGLFFLSFVQLHECIRLFTCMKLTRPVSRKETVTIFRCRGERSVSVELHGVKDKFWSEAWNHWSLENFSWISKLQQGWCWNHLIFCFCDICFFSCSFSLFLFSFAIHKKIEIISKSKWRAGDHSGLATLRLGFSVEKSGFYSSNFEGLGFVRSSFS